MELVTESQQAPRQFKYLALIYVIYAVTLLSSGLLANRMTSVGIFTQAGGTLTFPLTYLLGDIVAEVYGYKSAKNMIWAGLIGEVLFMVLTYTIVHLPSPSSFAHAAAYNTVIDPMPRVVTSAIVGILASGFLNAYILSKWKVMMKGRHFWFRSILSSAIGEAILTVLIFTIIFIGKMDTQSLLWLIFTSWLFKLSYTIIVAVPGNVITNLLKNIENIDIYDRNISFNPFKNSAAVDNPEPTELRS